MRLIALLLSVLVCGCTSTLTKAGLDTKATEHAGATVADQTYYVGSDDHYDYFVIRSGTGKPTHLYRVRQSEGTVTNRFDVTKEETRWREYHILGAADTNSQAVVPK